MKIADIIATLESFAPLPLQESYDNAGLQVGLRDEDCKAVLLTLDVTEAVVEEARAQACQLIVAHHPILFRGLKCISNTTQVERVVRMAVQHNIAIYAAHTNLDNVRHGVNFAFAQKLGLSQLEYLRPLAQADGGSGMVGVLPQAVEAKDFLQQLKQCFAVECLQYAPAKPSHISRVALCGGAGDFLIDDAIRAQADIFITGEMGYHRFFGHENEIWLAALGHYQSEAFTIDLFRNLLAQKHPELRLCNTTINTNPIQYL